MTVTVLYWLRNDLRVADNPALRAAIETGARIEALHVFETDAGLRPIGAARAWWVRESLSALAPDLARLGIPLTVVSGDSAEEVPAMARRLEAETVFWSRRYGRAHRAHDAEIKTALVIDDIAVKTFNAGLLVEPWEIETGQGKPYSVFTPFWKSLKARDIAQPVAKPRSGRRAVRPKTVIEEPRPAWARKVLGHWEVGEAAARARLAAFVDDALVDYADGRDRPGEALTSRLSPYLRSGEIGPRQVWSAVRHAIDAHPRLAGPGEKFLSELAWREFSHHLLYHRDDIATVPMQPRFAGLDWRKDDEALARWQAGTTGIPIIDAGMRQLWETGWMHNRVRLLVASLLSKNLLVDWRLGEEWFWDTLVDADGANNAANWQWVAGSGADAAPYFRIFNPATQGRRFDADGGYVREWVPELARMPDRWIHAPWEAPEAVLREAGVTLGDTYPEPIVDLKASRARALAAYEAL